MRLPNGYGSVIKLGGRRRKPYAVRITTGYKVVGPEETPRAQQTYKYLEYFAKRSDAIRYLSDYNAGIKLKEHEAISDLPTFADIYKKWMEEKENSRKGMGKGSKQSYTAAYKKFADVHDKKICNIRHADLQEIINRYVDNSQSTVSNMLMVCRGVAGYAIKNEYITSDFSAHLTAEWTDADPIHTPFTHDEILRLWKDKDHDAAQFALVCIYSGMRPSEVLQAVWTEEDLDRGYIVTGMKTKAGRDRVIPLHPAIVPIIRNRLTFAKHGRIFRPATLGAFRVKVWAPYMEWAGLNHLPHDGKHTCATLLEKAGVPLLRRKLILGHSIRDVTEGVYTHVSPEDLIEEIKKIEV